ncbi:MAG: DUF3365 domain-containing protein [Burkholderiales bacterium]|nr:MAG: DUF3365 domain-containing protein [Burkholderiales bacterium]
MTMRVAGWALLAGALFSASTSAGAPSEQSVLSFVDRSRAVAQSLVSQIAGELVREMEASGPLRGIIVCKYTAPEVAAQESRRSGMRVTRVSRKPRNPALGFPDVWEQRVLAMFDEKVASGVRAETLEHWEVVQEPMGTYLRYMKAIPTKKLCLNCHGPIDQISSAVLGQLGHEYPHDTATGFTEGSVRGAVTVKKLWTE